MYNFKHAFGADKHSSFFTFFRFSNLCRFLSGFEFEAIKQYSLKSPIRSY